MGHSKATGAERLERTVCEKSIKSREDEHAALGGSSYAVWTESRRFELPSVLGAKARALREAG